jgi:hypothetical protein
MNPVSPPLIMSILLIATCVLLCTIPQVAFAGFADIDIGWKPLITNFSDGAAPEAAPEPVTEQKRELDVQEIAARNAANSEQIVSEGKSAPTIPATAANLGRFQRRDTLPPEERKHLEPQETEIGRQAREDQQRQEQENRQREEAKRQERFEAVNPQEQTS